MFSRRTVLILISLAVLIVNAVMLILLVRRPQTGFGTERATIGAAGPFQSVATNAIHEAREFWRHYFHLASAARENDELRQTLRQERGNAVRLRELELAQARFDALLGMRAAIGRNTLAASIVARDPSPWYQTCIIDRGMDDGVHKGMAVTAPDGVVGVVVTAAGGYARVLLITDANSAVDGMAQESRIRGMVKGSQEGRISFSYVLRRDTLAPGDVIVTSGMDRVFPKGLNIGTVESVQETPTGMFQVITLKSGVSFDTLEEVLVILDEPPDDPLFRR